MISSRTFPSARPRGGTGTLRSNGLRAHRRQFVIGPEVVRPDDSWASMAVGDATLSYSTALPIARVEDRDGQAWHLLGLPFQSDPARPDPVDEVAANTTRDVQTRIEDWFGRWVLLGEGVLQMDASGTLGCFYRRVGSEFWVSSSPALLASLPGRPPAMRIPAPARGTTLLDWCPAPNSRFEGISRLFPSQVLDLVSGVITPRPLLSDVSFEGYEETLDFLETRLVTAVRNLARSFAELWVPLTAGNDSRLVLAAACHSGVKVTAYTSRQDFLPMSTADRRIPPKLARAAGFKHVVVRRRRPAPQRWDIFDAHVGESLPGWNRNNFVRGHWDEFPKSAFVLTGGVFEIGRCHYRTFLGGGEPSLELVATRFNLDPAQPGHAAYLAALAHWFEWVEATPNAGLDWRDRFYLEQRIGAWLSSSQFAQDLVEPERGHIVNSREVISTLLSIPNEIRCSGKHHVDLIERMAPELLAYPFNPPDPAWVRLTKRVRQRVDRSVERLTR